MRPHGRAKISRSKPQAQACCDRCGFRYAHTDLHWQFDWTGPRLQNLYLLVCQSCLDKPQENIRTIVLPPDPRPIANPRAEAFVSDNNPISPLGWDAANLFPQPPSPYGDFASADFLPTDFLLGPSPANFGSLTGHGGPDAAFFGGPDKMFIQSATLTPSSSFAGTNVIVKNWSASPGPVLPASLAPIQQSYVINQAIVFAPVDAPFLGSGLPTTIELDGSNDSGTWTALATVSTIGAKGENVTLTSSGIVPYAFHRIQVAGDGVSPVAIAKIDFYVAGPSAAQMGSELGA